MKKIILASASPQRKKLFRMLKLPFVVRKSGADEIAKIKTSVAALVKENALLKARDVAQGVRGDALVIGADTVVYAGGRLILKPRDLAEARKNLKLLMSEPHWVYTGVAVVDAASGKSLAESEKTRVFMHTLSDEEIARYHKLVSPLDKAGGFDIEGRGGLFIPRIEGCYFNVVGLPLARLCRMLRQFGVQVLMLVMMVSLYGCSGIMTNFNTATDRQETSFHSTDSEQQLGASVAQSLEKEFVVVDELAMNEKLDRITERIAKVCDRKELVYISKVVDNKKPEDEPVVNALSLPGGYVYVFKGLMDYIKNDDQLAAVVAHEIGHVTARHSMKRLEASYGNIVAILAAMQAGGNVAGGVAATAETMFFKYSQEDELQADSLGVKYMAAAGYNPRGMVEMLEKLQEYDRKQPIRPKMYGRTHPYIHQRIASANRLINNDLAFRDYIRLTGERDDYAK